MKIFPIPTEENFYDAIKCREAALSRRSNKVNKLLTTYIRDVQVVFVIVILIILSSNIVLGCMVLHCCTDYEFFINMKYEV